MASSLPSFNGSRYGQVAEGSTSTELPPLTSVAFQQPPVSRYLAGENISQTLPPSSAPSEIAPSQSQPNMMLHHPSPAPMNVFGYENPQLLGNTMPRPMSISPASQYDSTYSGASMMDYSPVVPQDRQDDQQGAYTRPASYDYRQFSSVPVTVGYQLPVDYSAQGRLTHLDGDNSAYRYSGYASSPHDSLGSVSPGHHGMQPPLPQHQHHHHRLPSQQSPYGRHHRNSSTMDYPSSPDEHGPPSVVGQPGMPDPAPRPKGPKLKFTPEDDALLIELKETKNLTWKQIADFFPDRSAGTLQVRYCTKLKAKTTNWTDEAVSADLPHVLHLACQSSHSTFPSASLHLTARVYIPTDHISLNRYKSSEWPFRTMRTTNGGSSPPRSAMA